MTKNIDPTPATFPDVFGDTLKVYDFEDGTAQLEVEILSSFDNTAVVYTHHELTALRNHLTRIIDNHQERTQ